MNTTAIQTSTLDRKKVIQSYGFVEQLSSNKDFLQESLELAARISGCETAYISLLDDEYQYILSQHQSELKTIHLHDSICQITVKSDDMTVIENTLVNEMTKYLPQVDKEGGIRSYAGCPLINSDNIKIGALCVMDTEKRSFSKTQQDILVLVAKQVMTTLDNQRSLIQLIKKINTNFKPAACSNLNCLAGELDHLHNEAIAQNNLIKDQKLSLENSNKELTNFANMVAHDVRAPLRTINNFIDLHVNDLQDCNKAFNKEYLDFIKQAATNLDELTNGLLEYAKSGDIAVKNDQLNLNQILETVTFNLTETIQSTNAKIVLPNDTHLITGKKIQLIQLFQNLIGNGLKYQNGKVVPCITIQAKEIGDKVRVSVIDNGIGISEDNLNKIFEPFRRLHNAQQYSGSGIGLATCKKIIDQLGSDFLVNSKLGEGSSFMFDLPRAV